MISKKTNKKTWLAQQKKQQWLATQCSHYQLKRARAENECWGLLIIDQGPLIKYNTWTNHVITIIIWLGIHCDISTVSYWEWADEAFVALQLLMNQCMENIRI